MADQFNEEEFKRIIQVEQEDAKKYNENLTVRKMKQKAIWKCRS